MVAEGAGWACGKGVAAGVPGACLAPAGGTPFWAAPGVGVGADGAAGAAGAVVAAGGVGGGRRRRGVDGRCSRGWRRRSGRGWRRRSRTRRCGSRGRRGGMRGRGSRRRRWRGRTRGCGRRWWRRRRGLLPDGRRGRRRGGMRSGRSSRRRRGRMWRCGWRRWRGRLLPHGGWRGRRGFWRRFRLAVGAQLLLLCLCDDERSGLRMRCRSCELRHCQRGRGKQHETKVCHDI